MAEAESNGPFSNRRLSFIIIAIGMIFLAGFPLVSMASPPSSFSPSAIKNTGGCGINCFRALAFGTTYCTGLVSNGMTMTTSGTMKANYVINVQISNDTGTIFEIQADLIDTVTNNNYLSQGFCGTFKGGSPQELGIAMYLPFRSQFFGVSAVIDYPINTASTNKPVAGQTYFASITIRPFALNGTAMGVGTGSVNTRLSTVISNGIGLLETS